MCFSAGASFSAAAVLGVTGAIAFTKAKGPRQHLFATVPLLFAVQQACEGFLWLAFHDPAQASLQRTEMYVFLFFAQFLWPFWMPLTLWLNEKNSDRKKNLFYFLCAGIATSLLLGYRMLFYTITAHIKDHHIFYDIDSPQWIITVSSILYVAAIIFPPFISTLKGMRFVGFVLLLSLLFSKFFFSEELISTWCFFAATLSAVIVYVISRIQEPPAPSVA